MLTMYYSESCFSLRSQSQNILSHPSIMCLHVLSQLTDSHSFMSPHSYYPRYDPILCVFNSPKRPLACLPPTRWLVTKSGGTWGMSCESAAKGQSIPVFQLPSWGRGVIGVTIMCVVTGRSVY